MSRTLSGKLKSPGGVEEVEEERSSTVGMEGWVGGIYYHTMYSSASEARISSQVSHA